MDENTKILCDHPDRPIDNELRNEIVLRTDSQPLRGAIVGYGLIASTVHLPAYQKRMKDEGGVEIVAIADITPGRLQQARRDTFHSARLYSSYQDMLLKERANLDFVDIATPPSLHAEIINYALDLGLHSLCERPITTTPKEIQEIIKRAEERGRVVFPVNNSKYSPIIRAINEIVFSGSIGDICYVTLQNFFNTHPLGVAEWNPHWRRDHNFSGGGVAMDCGVDSFYLALNWLNSYPQSITANKHTLRSYESYERRDSCSLDYDVYLRSLNATNAKNAKLLDRDRPSSLNEDNFTATLKFEKGLANVHFSWTAGIRKFICTLHGTKGAVVVDDDEMQIATMQLPSADETKWEMKKYKISPSNLTDYGASNCFNSLLNNFMGAINSREYVSKDLLDSALCIEVINAAYASANTRSLEAAISHDLYDLIKVKSVNIN